MGTTIPANLRGGLPTRVKDYTRLGLKAILFSETTLLLFQTWTGEERVGVTVGNNVPEGPDKVGSAC